MAEDSVRDLYNRFREDHLSNENAWYDEDDLIEIYDYASDINDDFTRFEVLLTAARLHPRSVELRDRRTAFYYQLGYDNAVKAMLATAPEETAMSRLLALQSRHADGTLAAELHDILRQTEPMEDEEVLWFMGLAGRPENYAWLKEHADEVAEACVHKDTFKYELATSAEENADYPYAIAVAEELTQAEPFNMDYWQFLAEVQENAGRPDDALQSLDFALALDPGFAKSLAMKGRLLHGADPRSEEALDLLTRAARTDGGLDLDSRALDSLADMLHSRNLAEEGEALFRDMALQSPDDELRLTHYMSFTPGTPAKYRPLLRDFAAPRAVEGDFWKRWAGVLTESGLYLPASEVLLEAWRRNLALDAPNLMLEALYRAKAYEAIPEFFKRAQADTRMTLNVECELVLLMALVRLGRRSHALERATMLLEGFDHSRTPSLHDALYHRGVASALRNIQAALMAPETLDPDSFDPLYIPEK